MVEETAQHAGHADIIRELIDGKAGDDHEQILTAPGWESYLTQVQPRPAHSRPSRHQYVTRRQQRSPLNSRPIHTATRHPALNAISPRACKGSTEGDPGVKAQVELGMDNRSCRERRGSRLPWSTALIARRPG
jgi:hypothetical protein